MSLIITSMTQIIIHTFQVWLRRRVHLEGGVIIVLFFRELVSQIIKKQFLRAEITAKTL